MCRPLKADERRLIIIDSRRAEPFVQAFDERGTVGPAGWHDMAAITGEIYAPGILLAGDGAPAIAAALPDPPVTMEATGPIEPSIVCRLAIAQLADSDQDPPRPVYLRPPDANPAPTNSP